MKFGLVLRISHVLEDKLPVPCYVSSYITIVQIIFHFLLDHWAHFGISENGVLLMYTLEGVSSVANFITAYEEFQ